ncbi:FTR1 family protein [Terrilactibacillus sp. S3-3]|nr:FTR1 family protein [Terrilactibacillus sp. S3-3]
MQQDWLSVEGDVVSQSQSVYTESEKDLVMIDAYLAKPKDRAKALPMISAMIANLKPLASNNYSIWDAALIPIREGMEALLVIGALLTFSKKANSKKAKRWVWSGTISAIAVCIAVGIIVSFLLSAAAFGNNNSLINGWSGVIASVMLLYVGYWLHRNADIQRWNHFIRSKTEQAMTQSRMISFAALAFIAVLREGMETVIFLIGMAGRMPAMRLILGIALGLGILVIIGFLMLKIGVMLPLRPFFLISSLIVFYLCFKFIGSGIHSLQMAGVIPSTAADYLPSMNSLSIFPSWYSTGPQALFLLITLVIVAKGQWDTFKKSKHFKEAPTQQ